MTAQNSISSNRLTGQDWFWILFIAAVATFMTFGGFLLFVPMYALALVIGYVLTLRFPRYFDRSRRWLFVLKVLTVVLPLFVALACCEAYLLPSVYRGNDS